VKKIPPYINSAVASRDFKYYIFDWDDNILHMPTKIRMERLQSDGSWQEVEVSTATFALIRTDSVNYRPPGGKWDEAFRNFLIENNLRMHAENLPFWCLDLKAESLTQLYTRFRILLEGYKWYLNIANK
jgi:hypothetical protein